MRNIVLYSIATILKKVLHFNIQYFVVFCVHVLYMLGCIYVCVKTALFSSLVFWNRGRSVNSTASRSLRGTTDMQLLFLSLFLCFFVSFFVSLFLSTNAGISW